ncbi:MULTISPECIES: ABC transporter ATP-binding protein [unclassified Paenibacillus]|uniref:ABC transporter ATP-binding protein n=1 Tax=unclassified Paenibacillus TaxID=185978 RepID=UPI00070D7ECD|nr:MULTISPECIES: ABC transporter ATP-binding protein [unclassified Paenibacillus]KQX64640.1 ABC transporter ATP-binding protein [Paenibacillus sp. Root444D2]KRE51893.1 ABC transporter ATP-binding protein [Paenibacillus sp. Soil724D2]
MTTDISIQLHGVSKQFDEKVVLDGITLAVPKAHIFGLLGPSGSGKTTLVRMIAGIDVPTSGTVHVLGQQMPQLAMLSKIGYMAQSDALYAELTAQENLEFFASLYGLAGTKRKQRIHDVMELVDLGSHLKKQISNYSGGMKRRLSLAISLLHEPGILILDEPTVGIDPVLRKSIWQELTNLSRQGTTILVTTHVMDEADKCHQLGMIRDGRLTAVGTPDELKQATSSATIEEAFLYYGGVNQ